MKGLKKYGALCGLMVLSAFSHTQIQLVDLGWVYTEYNIKGCVGVKNVSNEQLTVKAVRSSEDNLMNYGGNKIKLLPNQGVVVYYTSNVLSRKYPNDQSIICDFENHNRKKSYYIPVKLVIEVENSANRIIEERFVPSLSTLREDISKKVDCFSEPTLAKDKILNDYLLFDSTFSSFKFHEKLESGFLISGELVIENKSSLTYELLKITSKETKKTHHAKNKRYKALLSHNLYSGYNIISFQWELKKIPKTINLQEIISTTLILSLLGDDLTFEVHVPIKLSVKQMLTEFNFNTTKL
jgi:hypothetical protein